MANPLMGYVPEESVNPFFDNLGGYYVGKRLPRPPKIKPEFKKPSEVSFDFTGDLLRFFQNETNIPGQIKKYLIDEEVKSFERMFQVTVSPGGGDVSAAQLDLMEEVGQEAGYPGIAGASISLNPLKWAENPGKMLQETASEWANNLVNTQEIDSEAKAGLWKAITTGETPPKIQKRNVAFGQAAVDALTTRTARVTGQAAFEELKADRSYNNPLQLKGRGEDYAPLTVRNSTGGTVEVPVDAPWAGNYQALATATTDFFKFSDSGSRDKKHDSFLKNTSNALVMEIQARTGTLGRRGKGNLNYVDPVTGETKLIENADLADVFGDKASAYLSDPKIKAKVDLFVAKEALADSMEDVNGKLFFLGLSGVNTTLSKISLEAGKGGIQKGKIWDTLSRTEADATEALQSSIDGVGKYIETSEAKIHELRQVFERVKAFDPVTGAAMRDSFDKSIRGYEDLLSQFKTTLFETYESTDSLGVKVLKVTGTDVINENGRSVRKRTASPEVRRIMEELGKNSGNPNALAKALNSKLAYMRTGGLTGAGITGGTILEPSYVRKLRREMIEDGLGIMSKPEFPEYAISSIAEDLGIGNTKALRVLTYRLQLEREQEVMEEFLRAWKGGRLWGTYVYAKKLRTRFEAYTPSFMIDRFLNSMQYFGLKIDEDDLWNPAKTPAWVRNYITKNGAFKNTIELNVNYLPNNKKLKVAGTRDFEGALVLFELRTTVVKDATTNQLVKLFETDDEFKKFLKFFFIGEANLTGDDKDMYLRMMQRIESVMGGRDFSGFAEKAFRFRDWLTNKGRMYGLDISAIADSHKFDRVYEFMQKLFIYDKSMGLGSVTAEYMGYLEKFGVKLNQIAGKVLGKLAPYISAVVNLKTIVTERLTDILIGFITSATGGTGGISMFMRGALRWVVAEVVDFAESFIDGFRKGDLSKIFMGIEKTVRTVFKYALLASMAPLGCIAGVLFLVAIVISTYAPVNLTRNAPTGTEAALAFAGTGNPTTSIECTSDRPSLASLGLARDPGAGAIANRAYDIVSNLKQGFWCLWNWSDLDYPDLFNQTLFNSNPNPSTLSDGSYLFWCTWLVLKSFEANGTYLFSINNGQYNLLNAEEMRQFFGGNANMLYVSAFSDLRNGKVKPGDAVVTTSPNSNSGKHVGVVYKATDEYIIMVNSNSGLKYHTFTLDENGQPMSSGGLSLVAFGRKR